MSFEYFIKRVTVFFETGVCAEVAWGLTPLAHSPILIYYNKFPLVVGSVCELIVCGHWQCDSTGSYMVVGGSLLYYTTPPAGTLSDLLLLLHDCMRT